jgi:hypothetical protein
MIVTEESLRSPDGPHFLNTEALTLALSKPDMVNSLAETGAERKALRQQNLEIK